MEQIKENQIIPSPEVEQNPYFAPPRDLSIKATPAVQNPAVNPSTPTGQQSSNGAGAINYGEAANDAAQAPATPAILMVKEQRVNINDGGKATIDVILEVQDIPGVTEYDIRVAKDAGNL